MRINYFSILTLLFSTLFISCSDDDKTSKSPVMKSLTVTPNEITSGTKPNGIIEYSSYGSYIQSITYRYTISDGSTGTFTKVGTPSEPLTFDIEDVPTNAGTYTIVVSAEKVRYSANGENGTIFGQMNSVSTTFSVKE